MPTTILQGPSGDWTLTNGQLLLERRTSYVAAIKLRNRFKFRLGEWRYDIRLGVPYEQIVFRKGTPLGVIKRLFTDVILSVGPTIERVDQIATAVDRATRELAVYFTATANDKRPITGGTDRPFIVGNEYTPPEGT